LFSELLLIYLDRLKALVKFVNSNCEIQIRPDVENDNFNDLIHDELNIYQSQSVNKTSHFSYMSDKNKHPEIKLKDLFTSVLRNDSIMHPNL